MSLLITILFLGLNGYFAYQSFRRKDWMWFSISLAIAFVCGLDLLRQIS